MAYRDGDTDEIKEAYIYTYDKNSNIVSERIVSNYVTDDTGAGTDITREYTYDALGRLIKSEESDGSTEGVQPEVTEYTYDNVGNRLTESKPGEQTSYTYNGLNQLTSSVKTGAEAERRTYTYDDNGNQTSETTDTDESRVYEYDEANRLSTLTVKENDNIILTQENRYNGDGQRIQKKETRTVPGLEGGNEETKVTNYFYHDGAVLYTKDEAGTLGSMNLMGISSNIISTSRGTGDSESRYLYNKDIRESTTSIIGADGTAAAAYEYDEFGGTTVKIGADFDNEICYTGQIYDKASGLYYYNARYYNPNDGRFITQDTYRGESAEPDTLHLYAYCANNPINYTDPSGHRANLNFGNYYIQKVFSYYSTYGLVFKARVSFSWEVRRKKLKKALYNKSVKKRPVKPKFSHQCQRVKAQFFIRIEPVWSGRKLNVPVYMFYHPGGYLYNDGGCDTFR